MDISSLLGVQQPTPVAREPLYSQLKKHRLSVRDMLEFLKLPAASPIVTGHPSLNNNAVRITPKRIYAIEDIVLTHDGKHLKVTVSDDDGLRYEAPVQIVDTLKDAQHETLEPLSPLVLALESVRLELKQIWRDQVTEEADLLKRRFEVYQEIEPFEKGDLVCYKNNMMINGKLSRRGTAIVVEVRKPLSSEISPCGEGGEALDVTIGVIDSDGDFALMNISARRLRLVPSTEVGSFNNPYAQPDDFLLDDAAHRVADLPELDD